MAIASWLCLATLFAESSFQWRFPVACQILFALIVLCLCPFLPETPRWLAKHGRVEEARATIARLLDHDQHSDEVTGQLNEILDNIAVEDEMGEPTWTEVCEQQDSSIQTRLINLCKGILQQQQDSQPSKSATRHGSIQCAFFIACETGHPRLILNQTVMNQWSGINSVCYYLGFILQTYLGFSQVNSLILAGAGQSKA